MSETSTPTGPGPLSGYRVIDLTTVLMGPYATRMLGDQGADVIRIEPPSGEFSRMAVPARNPGMGGFVMALQRNKRSVAMDLKQQAGRDALIALIGTADVLVTNMRAEALARLGLDHPSLVDRFPNLVYVAAQGFGQDGPYAPKAAYDDAIQAGSGLAWLMGQGNDEPAYVPSVIADKITGLHIAQATLAALLWRERTGEGQLVQIPMLETMVAFNIVEHQRGWLFEPPLSDFGYERLMAPERKPYRTKDGWLCLLPYNDKNWRDFFGFVGRPELADDPRFVTHSDRIANISDLYAFLEEAAATKTTEEWRTFCDAHSIPASPVLDLSDMNADPHLEAVGMQVIDEHPTEGSYKRIKDPTVFNGSPTALRSHAPRLGQHSVELLEEIGLDTATIDQMITDGAIVDGRPDKS